MIQFQAVRFSIGGKPVLDEVSFAVPERTRVGLIGRNGAGKTMILRLILGEIEPEEGEISRPREASIGYLPQASGTVSRETLLGFVLAGDPRMADLERRIASLEARLASSADPRVLGEAADAHARLLAEYEARGGPRRRGRAEGVLKGLGFPPAAFDRPVAAMSGGEKSRAALARLLVQDPDILLLDEPTNHLDVAMTEWLEGWLAGLARTVIAISHDRYFLDRAVSRILELERGRIEVYGGGFEAYVREKARRREARRCAYERQQAVIRRNEAFIRRNIAGQNTRQARSRRRLLERMERLERPPADEPAPAIRFDGVPRGGARVLRAEGIAKRYGDRTILSDVALELRRAERLAVVGPNGSGKTTLLDILAGRLAPDAGRVAPGPRTRIGYLRQELDDLPHERSAFDWIRDQVRRWTNREVRDHLARFLLRGERVFARLGDLSGGERRLVALAGLIVARHNLLLLDEPTNHLDIASRGALEEALASYPETIVLVTHDRYLVDRLATRLLLLDGGGAREFAGNWTAYIGARGPRGGRPRGDGGRRGSRPVARPAAEARALARRIERIEAEIEAREAELGELRDACGREANWRDPERMRALKRSISRIEGELRDLYATWEGLADALPPGAGGSGPPGPAASRGSRGRPPP